MPIYAYKCSACGFEQDVLRKISDAPLAICPSCGKATFNKQLTAAGFQLKGSGWYATDFKGGAKPATAETKSDTKAETTTEGKPAVAADTKPAAESAKTESKSAETKSAPKPAPSDSGSNAA